MRSTSIKSTPVPINMLTTLPWGPFRSSFPARNVPVTANRRTCPAVQDCTNVADQRNRHGIFKVRKLNCQNTYVRYAFRGCSLFDRALAGGPVPGYTPAQRDHSGLWSLDSQPLLRGVGYCSLCLRVSPRHLCRDL